MPIPAFMLLLAAARLADAAPAACPWPKGVPVARARSSGPVWLDSLGWWSGARWQGFTPSMQATIEMLEHEFAQEPALGPLAQGIVQSLHGRLGFTPSGFARYMNAAAERGAIYMAGRLPLEIRVTPSLVHPTSMRREVEQWLVAIGVYLEWRPLGCL